MITIFILVAHLLLADGSMVELRGNHQPQDYRTLEDCQAEIPNQMEFIKTHLEDDVMLVDLVCLETKDNSI